MFDLTADIVFSDGPSSNPNQPQKAIVRRYLRQFEDMISAGLSNGGLIYDTKASMDADLAHDANASAWVMTGDDAGIYRKSGASGSGAWAKIASLPYSVVYAQNEGSGTADAVKATASVPVSATANAQLISIPFIAANTGAMTISINGEAPRPLVTNTGEAIPAGYVADGMSALVQIDSEGKYRLFSYGDATAVQAAAEAWAQGTAPGGPGTKSAKEWADSLGDFATNVQLAQDARDEAAGSATDAAQSAAQIIDNLGYLATPASLLAALSDPLLPMPSFIEGWTSGDFAGIFPAAPSATGLSTDSMGALILEYTVTGTAGSQTLTISAGDESKGGGSWGAVIQHDDGSYGVYRVGGLAGGACTIWPNLRKAVTGKTMRNLGGGVNGQHYTEPGYRALARRIFGATRANAYRARYVAAWDPLTGVKEDWTPVGGMGAGQYGISINNNYINNAGARSFAAFISRSRRVISGTPTTPYTGKGLTKSFSLKGKSGVFETFACCAYISNAAGGGFYPFTVVASVDGVQFLNKTYTENDGLVRVVADFPAGTTGTVTITFADDTPVFGTALYIDSVTWWVYDRLDTWTNPVIDKNVKTSVIGDSWTTFYPATVGGVDGVLGRELQSLMVAAGGTGQVVSVGTGGTTAEFGLTEFDAKVTPQNPKQVIILYFTNDHNQYGDDGYARWLSAMFKLGRKCQMIGARPIFVMPLPTSSLTQAIGHGIWATALGKGLPLAT
ncbi:hypothetical protein [Aquamicrobium soli]|uniref:SGNH/GDSL hydrolase family protein n=1 Tax=Aquamicrobium soli TaxID=1811518 RepID=A0ABV7KFL4_9HYPH